MDEIQKRIRKYKIQMIITCLCVALVGLALTIYIQHTQKNSTFFAVPYYGGYEK